MFCMNCGQQLPDGAKFCMKCGTPQGAVSPVETTQAETINLDGAHTFVPAMCPNCNAHMNVDSSSKIARCANCGTECLVQDAIKTLSVKGNVQVGSATINVSGTNTDSLLQRVEIMLADGDFRGAMTKCDTILDSDPTNGKVYFYMLLADLRCRNKDELISQTKPFDDNPYYIKVFQYGDNIIKTELHGYIIEIKRRNEENERLREKRLEESLKKRLKTIRIGDELVFGTFNGLPMKWTVLNIQDHMAFIIKDDVLNEGPRPYHRGYGEDITWSDCTLRKWLNNEFYNESFEKAEKIRILPCKNINDDNPKFKTSGGVPTIDKIFLLSIHEAEIFLKNDKVKTISKASWWLRSPGGYQKYAADANNYGVNFMGAGVHECGYGDQYGFFVRPVMWIKLD